MPYRHTWDGPVVYRMYDATDRLLYVGCSVGMARRLAVHQMQTRWFPDVTRMTLVHFTNEDDALAAERMAIETEAPLHNVHFNRKRRPLRTAAVA